MSYRALDEAHSKNKEEQIFMVFASVVKGLKWDSLNKEGSCTAWTWALAVIHLQLEFPFQGWWLIYYKTVMVSIKETELLSSVFTFVWTEYCTKKNKETSAPAPVQFLYGMMLHILVKKQSWNNLKKTNENISINSSKCGNVGSYTF